MAKKLAPNVYQLSPLEGISITVDTVGNGFAVIANIDTNALSFAPGVPTRIGPESMNGLGSVHTINLRCFFTQGATNNANYTITAVDDQGVQLDAFAIAIVGTQPLPYQTLVQFIMAVK
jgi:hypothetical protein